METFLSRKTFLFMEVSISEDFTLGIASSDHSDNPVKSKGMEADEEWLRS